MGRAFLLLILAAAGCAAQTKTVADDHPSAIRCPETTRWDGTYCVGVVQCPPSTRWNGHACLGEHGLASNADPVTGPATGQDAASPGAGLEADREMPLQAATNDAAQSRETGSEATRSAGAPSREAPSNMDRMGPIDVFLLSDAPGSWATIDGFPAPDPPARTFLLEPGDHVVRIGAPGLHTCRFTLRDLEVGHSVTLKATLMHAESTCGRIGVVPERGKMADLD